MAVSATPLDYNDGNTVCKGEYFKPDHGGGPLPVVLVCHAWDGLVQEVRDKATKLAEAGYIAFAIDVFGGGLTLTDMADLEPTLTPYIANRQMLQHRLLAAVTAAGTIPGAAADRIAAIGYCFGGLCALDLARAGSDDIKAVVSFHGALLPNGLGDKPIKAQVLVLHGNDDPMVPPEQVATFIAEMKARTADWELVSYGNTVHAFTRPEANAPEIGAVYNEVADRRSWRAMLNFLEEVL